MDSNPSAEEILKKYANEKSYGTWEEFIYDSHDHTVKEATIEVMEQYKLNNNSDAVEFAEWITNKFIKGLGREGQYWYEPSGEGVGTTKYLYELFKSNPPIKVNKDNDGKDYGPFASGFY